jgi:signal transduction histidine kinase
MTSLAGRTLSPHGSLRFDRAITAALLGADMIGLATLAARRDLLGGEVAGLVVVALGTSLAFLRRRDRPLLLVCIVVAGYIVAGAIRERGLVTQLTGAQALLAVYALGSWSSRRRWAVAVPAALAVIGLAGALADDASTVEAVSVPAAIIGAPWLAGYAARMRRLHLAEVEDRLRRAEAERDALARQAVIEERARIARELHDVVAHHVSLIGVQAGAARTTLGRDESATRTALSAIESSSRDAVREMRQLLDVLGREPGDEPAAPVPDLAAFGRLCDGYSSAGLRVLRTTSGTVDHLPLLHASTLYRIAEEALTNITRHSTATECALHLHGDERSARVVVTDPGPPRAHAPIPPPGSGRGLLGMRQRVEMFGGALVAGPVSRGTAWVVDAWIPLVEP